MNTSGACRLNRNIFSLSVVLRFIC
jgi:hypothetical protein